MINTRPPKVSPGLTRLGKQVVAEGAVWNNAAKADSVPVGSPDDEYESDSVPIVRHDAVVGLFRQYHQIEARVHA